CVGRISAEVGTTSYALYISALGPKCLHTTSQRSHCRSVIKASLSQDWEAEPRWSVIQSSDAQCHSKLETESEGKKPQTKPMHACHREIRTVCSRSSRAGDPALACTQRRGDGAQYCKLPRDRIRRPPPRSAPARESRHHRRP